MRPSKFFLPLGLLLLALPGRAAAAEAGEEAKLREALRNVTLQLRSADSERANLQAAQVALADEKKALNDKLEALKKQVVAERAVTDKTIAELKAQLAAQQSEIAQLQRDAERWQASANQSAALAATKEADRAKLAAGNVALQRRVEDLQAKNFSLFQTGSEILTRYEKFSLGEALAAREPFVGTTRAKLENLVQGYEDKLAAARAKN